MYERQRTYHVFIKKYTLDCFSQTLCASNIFVQKIHRQGTHNANMIFVIPLNLSIANYHDRKLFWLARVCLCESVVIMFIDAATSYHYYTLVLVALLDQKGKNFVVLFLILAKKVHFVVIIIKSTKLFLFYHYSQNESILFSISSPSVYNIMILSISKCE